MREPNENRTILSAVFTAVTGNDQYRITALQSAIRGTPMKLNIESTEVSVRCRENPRRQDNTFTPRFVNRVLGDGNLLVGFQPLNTRPYYYVIRVDTSWHLTGCTICSGKCEELLADHFDDICDAIEDEYGKKESISGANLKEKKLVGDNASERWPAFDLGSGATWFVLEPHSI